MNMKDWCALERGIRRSSEGLVHSSLPWGPEAEEELRQLAYSGMSRTEIGERLGRTKQAIGKQCCRMGLKLPRDTYGGSYKTTYDAVPWEERKTQEERDRRMIRALAEAIYRGEHLPSGETAPLRLIG